MFLLLLTNLFRASATRLAKESQGSDHYHSHASELLERGTRPPFEEFAALIHLMLLMRVSQWALLVIAIFSPGSLTANARTSAILGRSLHDAFRESLTMAAGPGANRPLTPVTPDAINGAELRVTVPLLRLLSVTKTPPVPLNLPNATLPRLTASTARLRTHRPAAPHLPSAIYRTSPHIADVFVHE